MDLEKYGIFLPVRMQHEASRALSLSLCMLMKLQGGVMVPSFFSRTTCVLVSEATPSDYCEAPELCTCTHGKQKIPYLKVTVSLAGSGVKFNARKYAVISAAVCLTYPHTGCTRSGALCSCMGFLFPHRRRMQDICLRTDA